MGRTPRRLDRPTAAQPPASVPFVPFSLGDKIASAPQLLPAEDPLAPLYAIVMSVGFRGWTIGRRGNGYFAWTLKYTDGAGDNLYCHGFARTFGECLPQAAEAVYRGNWRRDKF